MFPFKEVIDLSMPMKSLDTAVFPGYPQPLRLRCTSIREEGYSSYVWMFVEHTSAHVDSPAHFLEDGLTIDQVPLSTYFGNGVVLDFSNKPPNYSITAEDVEKALGRTGKKASNLGPGWIMLFYTGYTSKSKSPEWMSYPELSDGACRAIVNMNINGVGFDAPSPDRPPFSAHKHFLPKKMAIYENLQNLEQLLNRDFLFFGAPLALAGGSASPVRAFAVVQ